MNEEHFWKTILTALEQGKQAVIVVIINQTGSAPNVPGAKMFVTLDNIIGTVGGGISEHNLFDRARSLLTEREFSVETVHNHPPEPLVSVPMRTSFTTSRIPSSLTSQ